MLEFNFITGSKAADLKLISKSPKKSIWIVDSTDILTFYAYTNFLETAFSTCVHMYNLLFRPIIIAQPYMPPTTPPLHVLLPPLFPPPPLLLTPHRASVALILRPTRTGPPDLLFIQRAARPTDPWSAHIAFPGGHRDSTDISDLHTAQRETREEIGLDLSDQTLYRLVGRLPDRAIRLYDRGRPQKKGKKALCAFVFVQIGHVGGEIRPNCAEVARVFWVSLRELQGRCRAGYALEREDVSWWQRAVGLQYVTMAAAEVLGCAVDLVEGERQQSGDVGDAVLWGMTLSCVGDLVERLGGRRVDWVVATPRNWVLGGIVWAVGEVVWWVWGRWRNWKAIVRW